MGVKIPLTPLKGKTKIPRPTGTPLKGGHFPLLRGIQGDSPPFKGAGGINLGNYNNPFSNSIAIKSHSQITIFHQILGRCTHRPYTKNTIIINFPSKIPHL